ncbi:hypothetical protein CO046_02490 [Candidatus Peregrinibacteria bacterium CG_4_9_14_0_2_um_filter_53_11]|nr:MAG: hypothetical protein CO046_02490 [Candidatus Peregrinibacteria bacterium CG_4_9_14_0_2_um_filter_53_11]
MSKTLNIFRKIIYALVGAQLINELFWRFRHITFKAPWAHSYLTNDSLNHQHRKLVAQTITEFAPIEHILEVGCASGPNLHVLREHLPHATLYGTDISKHAVKTGTDHFKKNGDTNIHLSVQPAHKLHNFSDKSVDVVLSDAVMIYIDDTTIKKVLTEMVRVARKAIVLCEQASDGTTHQSVNFRHNYKKLLALIEPHAQVTYNKISSDVWGGQWGKHGYIIKIIL